MKVNFSVYAEDKYICDIEAYSTVEACFLVSLSYEYRYEELYAVINWQKGHDTYVLHEDIIPATKRR